VKREGRKASLRCAIYTRVSTENGLEQEFNSLDNQREASEAYIKSQAHEGWKPIRDRYDDGGFSGGSMDRPALAKLLDDVRARRVDVIVVYKVDRLTRSLADFAKLVELFDGHDVSFISVTQAFNTTTSMGRLTLNMLLLGQPQEWACSRAVTDLALSSILNKFRVWVFEHAQNLPDAPAIAASIFRIETCHESSDCCSQDPRANHMNGCGVGKLNDRLIAPIQILQKSAESIDVCHCIVERFEAIEDHICSREEVSISHGLTLCARLTPTV
jgi:Resolvase, N terminal domain